MTLTERILTYCGGDTEQAEVVAESLIGVAGAEALATRLRRPAVAWMCERCHASVVDETGFCIECGHVTSRRLNSGC